MQWKRACGISRVDHAFVLDLQRVTSQVTEELAATGAGPQGARGELGDYRSDVAELAAQVRAGAELVLCLPCFEASTFRGFVQDARAAGVSCPIAPGVLPLVEAAEFRRICRSLSVELPESLDSSLKRATTSE